MVSERKVDVFKVSFYKLACNGTLRLDSLEDAGKTVSQSNGLITECLWRYSIRSGAVKTAEPNASYVLRDRQTDK